MKGEGGGVGGGGSGYIGPSAGKKLPSKYKALLGPKSN